MDLKIGSFFSAARTATTNAASSVYGFSKDILSKGYSTCFFLADRVSQVAGRFIPTAVSNTVQTYPRSFAFAAGAGAAVVVGAVVFRFFPRGDGSTPPAPQNPPVSPNASALEET